EVFAGERSGRVMIIDQYPSAVRSKRPFVFLPKKSTFSPPSTDTALDNSFHVPTSSLAASSANPSRGRMQQQAAKNRERMRTTIFPPGASLLIGSLHRCADRR